MADASQSASRITWSFSEESSQAAGTPRSVAAPRACPSNEHNRVLPAPLGPSIATRKGFPVDAAGGRRNFVRSASNRRVS